MSLRRLLKAHNDRTAGTRTPGAAAFALACILAPALVQAQTPVPHVRPETGTLRALTAQASARSPIVHTLIDRLDRSDVIVYVRHRIFGPVMIDGRIGLLSTVGQHRYLVIELACDRSELVQMATLGHELHHALEIAGDATVVDARTLIRFYMRVGAPANPMGTVMTFETQAAADTGARVRHELLTPLTRSANGS